MKAVNQFWASDVAREGTGILLDKTGLLDDIYFEHHKTSAD